MNRVPTVVAGLLLLLSVPHLSAQEPSATQLTFVFSLSAAAEQPGPVSRVVASSVELHLEQEGIAVINKSRPVEAGSLSPSLVELADEIGTPWVLQAIVQQEQQEQVTILLQLFNARDRTLAAEVAGEEAVGLRLDRAVADLTAELLDVAGDLLSLPGTETRPASPRTPPVESEPAITSEALPDHTLAIGLRYTPFVPVAGSGRYINVTPAGISLLVAALPFDTDAVAVGLGFNGLVAEAKGVAATATLQAASISLVGRISGTAGPVWPFATASGGVTLLLAENELLGSYTALVPSGSVGLGVDLWLADGLVMQLSVGFEVLFEQSILIMGFSPGVGLELRI